MLFCSLSEVTFQPTLLAGELWEVTPQICIGTEVKGPVAVFTQQSGPGESLNLHLTKHMICNEY